MYQTEWNELTQVVQPELFSFLSLTDKAYNILFNFILDFGEIWIFLFQDVKIHYRKWSMSQNFFHISKFINNGFSQYKLELPRKNAFTSLKYLKAKMIYLELNSFTFAKCPIIIICNSMFKNENFFFFN